MKKLIASLIALMFAFPVFAADAVKPAPAAATAKAPAKAPAKKAVKKAKKAKPVKAAPAATTK